MKYIKIGVLSLAVLLFMASFADAAPRRQIRQVSRDQYGNTLASATCHVEYSTNAGSTWADATIYSTQTGTSAAAGSNLTSDSSGVCTGYLDDFDYNFTSTAFRVTVSKTGYTTATYSNILVGPQIGGTYTIPADTTVTTGLDIPKGVILSVATGKTLTINGPFNAGNYQVLSGSGTVAFGTHSTGQINPRWFGATGDGSTDDSTAISNAITAAAGKTLYFPPGTYHLHTGQTFSSTVNVKMDKGAILDTAAGQTTTLTNTPDAGDYVIFSGSGTSAVTYGRQKAVWWSATPAYYEKVYEAYGGTTNRIDYYGSASQSMPPISSATELTTTLDCAGDWTCGSGWSTTGGVATAVLASTSLEMDIGAVDTTYRDQPVIYTYSFTVTDYAAGTLYVDIGDYRSYMSYTANSAVGKPWTNSIVTFNGRDPSGHTVGNFKLTGSGFSGKISGLSVKLRPALTPVARWYDSSDAISLELYAPKKDPIGTGSAWEFSSTCIGKNACAYMGEDGYLGSWGGGNTGENTAIGQNALMAGAHAWSNVAVGANSMNLCTACDNQVGVGENTLQYSQGSNNVAVGMQSLMMNYSGNYNVSIGAFSMQNGESNNQNVSIGHAAMMYSDTANTNVAVGYWALKQLTGGSYNTAVGPGSASYVQIGSQNTFVGGETGFYFPYDAAAASTGQCSKVSCGNPTDLTALSEGYYQWKFTCVYREGDKLSYAGEFTGAATGWTLGSGWAYGTNNVAKSGDGTGTLSHDAFASVALTTYRLLFTVSSLSVGSFTPSIGGTNGTAITADGTYVQYITAADVTGLKFTPTNTSRFVVDSIYIDNDESSTSPPIDQHWYYDPYEKAYLTGIPICIEAEKKVVARKLYRTKAETYCSNLICDDLYYYYTGVIGDNANTIYTDTLPDVSLGAEPPSRIGSIALGYNAKVWDDKEMVIGSENYPINNIYLGSGRIRVTVGNAGTTNDITLHGTTGLGQNKTGANIKIAAGKGTGSGSGGSVIVQTAKASGSGYDANSLSDRLVVDQAGNVGIGVSPTYRLDVKGDASLAVEAQLEGQADGDTGLRLKDTVRSWKIGVNLGSTGSGTFNIYDITGSANAFSIDTTTHSVNIPSGATYNINGSAHTHSQYAATSTPTFSAYWTLQSATAGIGGGLSLMTVNASASITASASVTITLNIPSGAVLRGCSARVSTALATGELWDLAYSGGSTATLCTGKAVAKQTKCDALIVPAVAATTTDLAITKNGGGSFTAQGVIDAVCYYDELTSMADAP